MFRRILLLFLFSCLLAGPAYAVCDFTVPDAFDTMDNPMVYDWCTNGTHRDNLWNCLGLDEELEFWQDQLAVDGNWCNPYGATPRLFNAQWFLGGVMSNRANSTYHQSTFENWYEFVCDGSPDGYANACGESPVARNYPGDLTLLFNIFYRRSVPGRASTLVHEAKHEEVHHCYDKEGCAEFSGCDDETVCTCGNSMDWSYGLNNATTWQLHLLLEAMDTYVKDTDTNELIILEYPSGECGYVPLLSESAYDDAKEIADGKFLHCFIFTPFHPERANLIDEIDFPHPWDRLMAYYPSFPLPAYGSGAKWPCEEVCTPDDFLWPDGASACNEDYQAGNQDINSFNRVTCAILSASVSAGAPLSVIRAAQEEFQQTRKPCISGVSDEYLQTYCSDLIPAASSVDELEALWTIDDEPGLWIPDSVFYACMNRYCEERFDAAWKPEAQDMCYEWSDPLGCTDNLCGILSPDAERDLDYFESVQCRRHYFEKDGNSSAYFDRLEGMTKCERLYTRCKNGEAMEEWLEGLMNGMCTLLPDTGYGTMYQLRALDLLAAMSVDISYDDYVAASDGGPPEGCEAAYEMCKQIQALNARIVAEFVAGSEFPLPRDPWVRSRVKEIDLGVKQLLETITEPTGVFTGFAPEQAVRDLTRVPENLHALSNVLGKEAFFALYGGDGFEKVFGKETASHFTGSNLTFRFELSPAQEALLPALTAQKDTRERAESAETMGVLESLANSDPETLFNFMRNVRSAENAGEINMLLDDLGGTTP